MAAALGFRRLACLNARSVVAIRYCVRTFATIDKETHTGQKWDASDYRNVRFTDREKEVNENFAINLVDEEPPTEVKGRSVWCDGGGGALGHPRVYINLDQPGPHACGYCGLRFFSASNH